MFGYNKNFLFALSILIGTIVGAGIFGIPYVISKSGIMPGFFYFLTLGVLVILIHLFFGEIVLRTKEQYRLPGYAQKYLGNWGKILITISTIVGLVGACLAYIIIGGDFLKIILAPFLNLSNFYFSLIFWAVLAFFIFRGIKLIAPAEFLMNIALIFVFFLIFGLALPKINLQNFTLINLESIFLPYGIILFSLSGWIAVPAMLGILKGEEKKKIKKIIILVITFIVILYSLFTLAVIGASGGNVTPEALQGLIPFLGSQIIVLGALVGLLAIATSFLIIGNYLQNTFFYDYKIPRWGAAFIAFGLPLILFLIGFRQFIGVIGFVGIIYGVIEGILIILIFKKAKTLGNRHPEYSLKVPSALLYFLMIIFILGAVSQIL